jgi:hypothetical protein
MSFWFQQCDTRELGDTSFVCRPFALSTGGVGARELGAMTEALDAVAAGVRSTAPVTGLGPDADGARSCLRRRLDDH